jgi:hypothetical protein
MPSLTHALLTEDEAVLLEALEPSPDDRVLALFARGNGDAGLSLLQAGPSAVFMFDLFDRESLAAQFELKRWLFRRLDNPTLRSFLGIAEGCESGCPDSIIAAAMKELPASCAAFWQPRKACLRNGMALNDSTASWCRTLDRFWGIYRSLPPPLRVAAIRLGRWLAPFYFPREERRHSLGYRQLMAQPEKWLEKISSKLATGGVSSLITYKDFRYLSPQGHEAIRRYLDRTQILNDLAPPVACNKIYLSNAIDYLPPRSFQTLLANVARIGGGSWRAFLNSTYASSDVHPHLRDGIREGLFYIDWQRTNRLRAMDCVGVYPGLTVIHSEIEYRQDRSA